MSIDEAATIEIDMRDLLLRAKRDQPSNQRATMVDDFSSLVHQISGRSVRKIDHLVDGLQGLRQKLHYNGAQLENKIASYAELSALVVQLTKIASDSMEHVSKASHSAES